MILPAIIHINVLSGKTFQTLKTIMKERNLVKESFLYEIKINNVAANHFYLTSNYILLIISYINDFIIETKCCVLIKISIRKF